MRSSIVRGSLSQSRPWWTSSRSALAAAARSNSSSEAETAQPIRVTSSAPATCSPIGP